MSVITKDELDRTLSEVTTADPLKWFMSQPQSFQQEIALLIRTESIDAAKLKVKMASAKKRRKRKNTTPMIERGTIDATIVRVDSPKGPVVRLVIETEYGQIIAKPHRSDIKYLILFIEDGAIVSRSLSSSIDGVKSLLKIKKYTHENAIPNLFNLIIKLEKAE